MKSFERLKKIEEKHHDRSGLLGRDVNPDTAWLIHRIRALTFALDIIGHSKDEASMRETAWKALEQDDD